MNHYLAIAGLVVVTIIWGGGFVASDMALESLLPFQIMAIRFFLGTVMMGAISIKGLKGIKKQEVKAGALMGAASLLPLHYRLSDCSIRHRQKCIFDSAQCGDGSVYCLYHL